MSIVDIIIKKRNGEALTCEEIHYFVQSVKDKKIENYQISALLMAIYFRGMNEEEIAVLTKEMAISGDTLEFPSIKEPIVDKHSSGGVGDKTSLVIAPIVAACGLPIAKLSGRGLGFTGGTIDKLESIPGFKTEISEKDFVKFVERDGISIIGQSADIAPVDKILYALRDVTGTVDSIPLIAASIMSKKLADGSDAIVLDVKYGSGAFMKTPEEAINLAKAMVSIGENNGKSTIALVTNMDQPLGSAVGNSLEVIEAIEALSGKGPRDFLIECEALSENMLIAGNKASNLDEAKVKIKEAIESGKALEKFKAMVRNQGGDSSYVDDVDKFPKARLAIDKIADKECYVSAINAEEIGKSSLLLGAGRVKITDEIDFSVGLKILKKVGDHVLSGEPIFTVYANDELKAEEAINKAYAAYEFSGDVVEVENSPIYAIVSKNGVDKQ